MVLENYVKLLPGVPKRLHFTGGAIVEKQITDPLTKLAVTRRSLVFNVDREDGRLVDKTWSTLSDGLASQLKPELDSLAYRETEYVITQVGYGFNTRYQIEKRPFVG